MSSASLIAPLGGASTSLIAPLGGASNVIVIHNYKILNKIGQGGFSSVYKAQHKKNDRIVALKIEKTKDSKSILHESKILSYLNRELLSNVVPTLFWYGTFGQMVGIATTFYSTSMTEILSQNLDVTVKMDLCRQLINIMRQLHSVFIIHCDVKPDNFMVQHEDHSCKLVIIDFGMSRLFVDSEQTTKHLPNKMSESLFGTPKYASYNVHLGHKYSRRDDLISIGYLFMTIFNIVLPWSVLPLLPNNEIDIAIVHLNHPHNLYRQDLKIYDNLVEYLRKTDFADILIPYFSDAYALKYDEAPNYTDLVKQYIFPG